MKLFYQPKNINLQDIIDWLSEHEQVYKDFLEHFRLLDAWEEKYSGDTSIDYENLKDCDCLQVNVSGYSFDITEQELIDLGYDMQALGNHWYK